VSLVRESVTRGGGRPTLYLEPGEADQRSGKGSGIDGARYRAQRRIRDPRNVGDREHDEVLEIARYRRGSSMLATPGLPKQVHDRLGGMTAWRAGLVIRDYKLRAPCSRVGDKLCSSTWRTYTGQDHDVFNGVQAPPSIATPIRRTQRINSVHRRFGYHAYRERLVVDGEGAIARDEGRSRAGFPGERLEAGASIRLKGTTSPGCAGLGDLKPGPSPRWGLARHVRPPESGALAQSVSHIRRRFATWTFGQVGDFVESRAESI